MLGVNLIESVLLQVVWHEVRLSQANHLPLVLKKTTPSVPNKETHMGVSSTESGTSFGKKPLPNPPPANIICIYIAFH